MSKYSKTGRLTSLEPQLQNIPMRTEVSKNLREAFETKKEMRVVGFNYNQLELRVLSELGRNTSLMKSFRKMYDKK